MPVSKMAPGCRCGALAISTMSNARGFVRRRGATVAINLIRPAQSGELPMRRIFEDQQGNEVGQLDLWKYGYDARKRPWYRETMKADRPLVSSPYLAFSIGAPVITVSAPLRGKVPGVLAADLKLDTFSDFVQSQRPGEHGIVLIFDSSGSLIAHPDFAQFVVDAMTHPSQRQLPNVQEINSGVVAAALRRSLGRDRYEGSIRDDHGRDYLFRMAKFTLGEQYNVNILLLAAQDDFAQNVRNLQFTGLIARNYRWRRLHSRHLDIWQRNVAILEKHNGPSGQASEAGCARPLVSRIAH